MATRKPATRKRTTSRSTSTTRKTVAKSAAKSTEKPVLVTSAAASADVRERTSVYSRFPIAALIGEFIGTFLLVGFTVVTQTNPLYAFFGLIAIVAIVGHLSGPHLNPAISIAAWLTRLINGRALIFYIIAQILGGLAAYGVLNLFTSGAASSVDPSTGQATAASLYGLPALSAGKEWYAFAAELIGSIILGFGVASAYLVRRTNLVRGFVYGGSVLLASFMAYASGAFAILNPVVAGGLKAYSHINWSTFNLFPVLVYVLAPIIGVALGFGLYRVVQKSHVAEQV